MGRKYKEKKETQGTAYRVPDVHPLNEKQKNYLHLLTEKQIVIASGDAGSGKTFLACYWAAKQYVAGTVRKIILTRPYVQMGKDAGAVPGSDWEKLEPYLKPMLINLSRFLGPQYQYMVDNGRIEVVTTEKIRGRSFDEPCILIGDELQNSTVDQMVAISTRIGEDCQMILCGDPKQHDLKGAMPGISYLKYIKETYKIDNIGVVEFEEEDCVRSGLARELLIAFAKDRKKNK